MLKMAELKQEGFNFFPCYFKCMKDIILIFSKSCSKFIAAYNF